MTALRAEIERLLPMRSAWTVQSLCGACIARVPAFSAREVEAVLFDLEREGRVRQEGREWQVVVESQSRENAAVKIEQSGSEDTSRGK